MALLKEAHAVDRWKMRRDAVPGVTLVLETQADPPPEFNVQRSMLKVRNELNLEHPLAFALSSSYA
jgi:hypothetical protein